MHPTNYKSWLGWRCAVSRLSVLAGTVTARRSDERESRESTKRSDESRKDEDEVGRRENDFAGISITRVNWSPAKDRERGAVSSLI